MRIFRILVIFGLLCGSTLFASVGKVALLKGEAVAERNAQIIALQNGSLLEEKDAIKTGKDAQIQLIFEDKTVITLGSESEFKIEEYLNDATAPKAKFKFNQGSFKSITGKIGKIAPENFTLETKTATIGIRGTIVKGQTGDAGDVIACLRGLITVMSRHTGKVVEVPAGQFTTVKPTQDPASPQETKPGTTDDSLAQNTPSTKATPAVVASVEQIKNDILSQSAFQTHALQTGTLSLVGLTTSFYDLIFSINRATGETTGDIRDLDGVFYDLSLSSGTRQITNYTFSDEGDHTQLPYPLVVFGSEAKYSYYILDSFFFLAGGLGNSGTDGYFVSASGEFTMPNNTSSQYVSWGIWGTDSWDNGRTLAKEQYWVAGATYTDPAVLLALGTTTYTYTGKVLGKTYDEANNFVAINTDTSNVTLNFKFGGTASPIQAGSSITFSSTQGDWTIVPTASSFDNFGTTFTATGSANVVVGLSNYGGTSEITGKVFGSNAQAVGGVFSTTGTLSSTGVFKAVR